MRRPLAFVGGVLLSSAWGFLDGFFVAPWPVAFWLISAAGLGCLAASPLEVPAARVARPIEGISDALILSGLLVSMQPALSLLMAHLHRIPAAADALVPLMGALGIHAGVDAAGNLLLGTDSGVRAFAITWEAAALPTLLRLLVAVVAIGGRRPAARNAALVLLYGAMRVLVLLALLAGGARLSLCFEPAITALGFIPVAFLCFSTNGGPPRPGPLVPRRAIFSGALLAVAGALLGLHFGYRQPGILKKGRVLIDESRSDWEWTEPPFDHARYGQRSVYNYNLWKAWIDLHYATRLTRQPPTVEDLLETDVLIIKTPTTPYDPETIRRIERYVRQGGGLYLIGDHTNLFGMSTVLNGIAAPYGLRFEFDDTFPLDHEAYDIFRPRSLVAHPVLRRIESYPFETSCTLRVPWSADHLIVGRRLGAEPVDYGHINFFGNIRLDPTETFGLFTQAAAVTHGAGSVVAFSDSTNFSNFSMLWPGRRELTLNVVDWLNRAAAISAVPVQILLLVGALTAAAGGALAASRCPKPARAAALWLGVGACALVAHQSSRSTSLAFGTPEARRPFRTVAFDTSLTSFTLEEASPILNRNSEPSWDEFNAFFINAARSGVWPEVTRDLAAALRAHETVALVNPVRRPADGETRALAGFLKRGGRLLVLDSILNARSTAPLIVAPFGLTLGRELQTLDAPPRRPVVPALQTEVSDGVHRRVTRGGSVVVWREVGAGRLVVSTDAALFSDHGFGGVYNTPRDRQRDAYEAQEDLLRILLEPRAEGASR